MTNCKDFCNFVFPIPDTLRRFSTTKIVRISHNKKNLTAKDSKIYDLEVLFPQTGEESRILLGCRREDFCASRIARAVEDCGAHLINLNVLAMEHPQAQTVVDIRVNRRNPAEVARSLIRYGFDILEIDSDGDSDFDSTLSDRVDELIHYLNL